MGKKPPRTEQELFLTVKDLLQEFQNAVKLREHDEAAGTAMALRARSELSIALQELRVHYRVAVYENEQNLPGKIPFQTWLSKMTSPADAN
jgi:hypothetical protein